MSWIVPMFLAIGTAGFGAGYVVAYGIVIGRFARIVAAMPAASRHHLESVLEQIP